MEIKHVGCCILNRYFKCVWMFFLNDCIIWKSNCRHFVAIVADKSAEVKMVCDLCEFNRVAEYTHMLTSAISQHVGVSWHCYFICCTCWILYLCRIRCCGCYILHLHLKLWQYKCQLPFQTTAYVCIVWQMCCLHFPCCVTFVLSVSCDIVSLWTDICYRLLISVYKSGHVCIAYLSVSKAFVSI